MSFDYLILIFKDLKKRKFSSFLTLFAISLGILSIYVIILLSQGFEGSIEKQFEQLGTNRLYVTASNTNLASTSVTSGLSDNDLKFIEGKPYVEKVYPYYFKSMQVEYGREFQSVLVAGTRLDEEFLNDLNIEIEYGRAPKLNEKFSLVVGPGLIDDVYEKNVRVGSNLYINNTKFKVVGIFKSLGNPQDDRSIYANIDTLRDIFNEGDTVGIIDVIVNENYDLLVAKENLQIALDNKFGKDEITITSPDQFLEQLNSILGIVNYTLGGIAVIALLVGALGIINTMYVIITEKTKEIGIMKAIGATNGQVLMIYMFQSGVFGLLGAILGVVIGSFVALGFGVLAASAGFTFIEISINYLVAVYLLIFGFVIGLIAGFLPSYQASKLNVMECLQK